MEIVHFNQKKSAKYIREQEAENQVKDNINKREHDDPLSKIRIEQ